MFKFHKLKLLLALCIIPLILNFNTSFAQATPVGYTQKQPMTDLISIDISCEIFGHTYEDVDARLYSGRLYIPLYTLRAVGYISATNTGLTIAVDGVKHVLLYNKQQAIPNVMVQGDEVYLNAFELTSCLGAVIDIDSSSNKVNLYKKSDTTTSSESSCKVFQQGQSYNTAYIRLEDIMADGMDKQGNPKYTDKNLLKLRALADTLHQNNQQYYVAWIPVFVDPATGYMNNLVKERTLYNANFLGTLDYLTTHGGRIGLHGYTHQYGTDASADGWEWGNKTPYTKDEQESRMVYAKNTAELLGLKYYFFEFPHYSATAEQSAMAEKYFNVICQKYPTADDTGIYNHNGTYWVPTPMDYIYYDGYVSKTIQLAKDKIKKGNIYSLFYHPTLDFDKIQVTYDRDKINISGQNHTNIFTLLSETEKMGYSFRYWLN